MPRKSLDQHKLQGTKPEYVEPTAIVSGGRPRYPKNLTPEAKRVFKSISRLMESRRSLTEADGELIRLLALTHVRHSKAISKLEEEGEIKVYFRLDKHGEQVASERPNLWLDVAQACEKQMISIYDRLGLTPLNRAKVKPTEPPKDATQYHPDYPGVVFEDAHLLSRAAKEPVVEEPDPDLSLIDENVIQ
ncbi:MAG TPA: P27 family phage terminase small subunit [Candidatus Acidoferrum sp.]|nr:P27 family phage terminase small subunit [Candidatus Acidoferrum sp.]